MENIILIMARMPKAMRQEYKSKVMKMMAMGYTITEIAQKLGVSVKFVWKLGQEIRNELQEKISKEQDKLLQDFILRYEDLMKTGYQLLAKAVARDEEKGSLYYSLKALRLLKEIHSDYANFWAKISGYENMQIMTNILNAPNISIEEFKEMIRKEMKELEKETLEELR